MPRFIVKTDYDDTASWGYVIIAMPGGEPWSLRDALKKMIEHLDETGDVKVLSSHVVYDTKLGES